MRFSREQTDAIRHVDGPMMVIAGPGSGKTTVITHRIKYIIESAGVSPADILVITFTRAAADEMQSRFKMLTKGCDYPVRFGTFHSIFFWIIKTAYNLNNSNILSEEAKRRLIEKLLRDISVDIEKYGNKEEMISNIISQIGIVKCDMLCIDNYYSSDMPEQEFRELYKRYEHAKKNMNVLDFDDMLTMCYELLSDRADILEKCRSLFKYIMVDEFQDSNRIQYEILKLLSGSRKNVFVVGDDDQSVYGFRGARPEIMQRFEKEFTGCKRVFLSVNYRCDSEITEASAKVIEANGKRYNKKLSSASKNKGVVKVLFPKDSAEENDNLIGLVRKHYMDGIALEKQAVLYRTNMQPRRLAYRLNQFNIPFTLSDMLPNIFEHFLVRDCMDYMHFAIGDRSRERFLRIMNKPVRYITRDSLWESEIDFSLLKSRFRGKEYVKEHIYKLEHDILYLSGLKPFAALSYIRRAIGYEEYLHKFAEEKNLDFGELTDILDEFSYMIKDMESYEELFDYKEEYKKELIKLSVANKDKPGLRLMTMHSSKGLEFDVVYIIDAVEGIMPYSKAKTKAELEEERRMFYVAMTRARHELFIYSPKLISGKAKRISRFIKG